MGTSKMKIFDSSILFFLLRHICAKGFRPCTKENVSLTPVRLVVFGRRNGLTKGILIQNKSAICGGHWRMNIFTIQESGGKRYIPSDKSVKITQIDHRLAGMNDIIMGRMIKLVFEANENLQIMELDVRYDEPDQAYVVGRDGCWSDSDCDRAILINGDGQCSACDGPLGQTGFCCRGDGYHSGCSEKLKRQITLNGFSGHACIYMLGNAQVRYPSKSDGNAYIARQVKWCILSDLSAGVCADQLVDNLKHDFDGNWGCMVTIGDGHASGYYYHLHNKYSVYCFPYSSTSMKRSDLIYMCRNAEHACAGETSVSSCMRDLLNKTPTFCPDKYTLIL